MDVHQLRVFASVFRNRSFSKASEELRLTQPTVSEHIRDLEEELGLSLFDRSGRSIHATSEAEILFTRASEIIERIGEIPGALSEHRRVLAGRVVVGASEKEMAAEQQAAYARLLGDDRARLIVVYFSFPKCGRSHNGAVWAKKLGYTNVVRYVGGIKAWDEADYPAEKAKD